MKQKAGAIGLILAAVFLVLGFMSMTPDKYIKSYGDGKMYEYVGGDAYNYIIEASLRGGEISGARSARAIYFSAAGILLVLSIAFLTPDTSSASSMKEIEEMGHEIRSVRSTAEKIDGKLSQILDRQDGE